MGRHAFVWLMLAAAGTGALLFARPVGAAAQAAPDCAVVPLAAEGAAPVERGSSARVSASHHRITATFDPLTHTVQGRQQLTWRNDSGLTLCTLYLHLDLNAFERSDTARASAAQAPKAGDWGYTELTHVRQGDQPVVWMYATPMDRSLVRLDLPQPVAPGASTRLDIGFVDRLPGAWAGIGHAGSFVLVAGWLPRMATLEAPGEAGARRWNVAESAPRETGLFDVRLDLPSDYQVAASGVEIGAAVTRGHRRIHRFVATQATDLAWAADRHLLRPLEFVYTPPAGPPLTLRVFHRREHAAAASAAVGAMADALGYYARTLGGPSQRTVSAVLVPAHAGALAGRAFPGLFTVPVGAPLVGGSEGEQVALATLRGVGDAYFADAAMAGDAASPGFARGMAAYWTARLLRDRNQPVHAAQPWVRRLGRAPVLDAFSALRIDANLHDAADSETVAAARLALALHDVEARIGIAAMDRAFRLYLRRPGSVAEPTGLREALVAASGGRDAVGRAFALHADAAGVVDDRIASFRSEEVLPQPGYVLHRGRRVELTQAALDRAVRARRSMWQRQAAAAQRRSAGPFPFRTTVVVDRLGARVPQLMQVRFADGSSRSVRWDGPQASQRFSWVTASPAVVVQLDPQRQVLLDRNKLDDGRTLASDSSPARRWGADVAAAVQIFSALLVSL